MFKFRKNLKISYQKQGYIHFTSHNYSKLKKADKDVIDELCRVAGGEYASALKRFMTTDTTAMAVCIDYFLSKATLYRCVDRYFKLYAERI